MGGPVEAAEQAALVAAWGRAGPAMAENRRREVAAMSDEEALVATEDLLSALDMLAPLPLRPGSGLVEQQRLFAAAPRP